MLLEPQLGDGYPCHTYMYVSVDYEDVHGMYCPSRQPIQTGDINCLMPQNEQVREKRPTPPDFGTLMTVSCLP